MDSDGIGICECDCRNVRTQALVAGRNAQVDEHENPQVIFLMWRKRCDLLSRCRSDVCFHHLRIGRRSTSTHSKLLGTCLGEQVRAVGGSRIPAEAMDIYLKQKCGHLEQQEQDEFFNFLRRQIGRTLTAETVAMIVAREIASPRDLRRVVVEAYKTVILDGKRN